MTRQGVVGCAWLLLCRAARRFLLVRFGSFCPVCFILLLLYGNLCGCPIAAAFPLSASQSSRKVEAQFRAKQGRASARVPTPVLLRRRKTKPWGFRQGGNPACLFSFEQSGNSRFCSSQRRKKKSRSRVKKTNKQKSTKHPQKTTKHQKTPKKTPKKKSR